MKHETSYINGVTVYVTIRNPKNARTRTKQDLHQWLNDSEIQFYE